MGAPLLSGTMGLRPSAVGRVYLDTTCHRRHRSALVWASIWETQSSATPFAKEVAGRLHRWSFSGGNLWAQYAFMGIRSARSGIHSWLRGRSFFFVHKTRLGLKD